VPSDEYLLVVLTIDHGMVFEESWKVIQVHALKAAGDFLNEGSGHQGPFILYLHVKSQLRSIVLSEIWALEVFIFDLVATLTLTLQPSKQDGLSLHHTPANVQSFNFRSLVLPEISLDQKSLLLSSHTQSVSHPFSST